MKRDELKEKAQKVVDEIDVQFPGIANTEKRTVISRAYKIVNDKIKSCAKKDE